MFTENEEIALDQTITHLEDQWLLTGKGEYFTRNGWAGRHLRQLQLKKMPTITPDEMLTLLDKATYGDIYLNWADLANHVNEFFQDKLENQNA